MILVKERMWCTVKERLDDVPEMNDEVSEQALAMICLSIDSKIDGLVRNAKTDIKMLGIAYVIPTSTAIPENCSVTETDRNSSGWR